MLFFEAYIFIPVIASVAVFIIVLLVIKGRKNSKSRLEKAKATDRSAVIREANKRLAQNPKDSAALLYLADLHYGEKNYEKALKLYEILLELCATEESLNEFEITLRHAICAINAKQYKAAYKSFLLARATNPDEYLINYNLGYLEYMRKNYEKAAGFLTQAKNQKTEDAATLKYLGLSLYKMNKYNNAVETLKKALELEPDNKEIAFALGECYYNLGQSDAALKAFSGLRNDSKYGAHACIYSGTIVLKYRNYDQAAMYFELGLKIPGIKPAMYLELKYRLANCHIKAEKIAEAIPILEDIVAKDPKYKDAEALLQRYGELDSNLNLKIFLMGDKGRFVSMCKKFINVMFPKTRIKILEVSQQQNEYLDIVAEVSASKWEDIILFRFIRTNGQTGELTVRDLYGRIKEVKAGRGFCVSAGTFSMGAKNFVEARLIDLMEKDELVETLRKIEK